MDKFQAGSKVDAHTFAQIVERSRSRSRARLQFAVTLTAIAAIALGYCHPYGNPRGVLAKGVGTLLQGSAMSPNARAVLITKCADCHSNETRWPIYARLAPGSWLIERDVVKGRKQMDLSDWNDLPPETQDAVRAKIVSQARSRRMPPLQYVAMHWRARLSPNDVQALAVLVSGVGEPSVSGPGDAARGKTVFEKRCANCHAMEKNKDGPKLDAVFGRRAGSVTGFEYSDALKSTHLTWTEATLDKWLADPDVLVPGNTMEFRISKAADRQDVIAYLKR